MKHSTSPYVGIIRPALAFIAIFFSQHVMAVCLIEPEADKILSIDANQGCDNIAGHQGCFIKNAIGSCSSIFPDGKTLEVTSSLGANGAEWDVTGSDLGVKAAIINGGSQGKNNCAYMYDSDAFDGFGGDLKSNGDIQNITGAFFCSDGQLDAAEVIAEPMPMCGTQESDPLDNTGIQCGSDRAIVCNFEIDEPRFGIGDGENCCVCNITEVDTCLEGDTDCQTTEDGVRAAETTFTIGLQSPGAWRDGRGVWHFY